MEIKFFDFQLHGDDRGSLISIESNKDIPFPIKRVYYIFNSKKGGRRGFHAHKELQQIAFCVSGSCKFKLSTGMESTEIFLDDPAKGLFIDKMIWREMYDFSQDCVLVVLASDYYFEKDYIRDFDEFVRQVKHCPKER